MSGYPAGHPAVKVARTVLDGAMAGWVVATKIPNERPPKLVKVSRAGGGRLVIVTDVARLLVEVWAETVTDAEQGCLDAIAALQNAQGTIVDGAFIRGFGNIEGPVDLPDPDVTEQERWQLLGDFSVSTS